jgi:hypothetical protein
LGEKTQCLQGGKQHQHQAMAQDDCILLRDRGLFPGTARRKKMNAWPDAARPGEPADTARAWHWLARLDDGGQAPMPMGWNAAARQWFAWDGTALAPAEAARRFRYLGPALTPIEVAAEAAQAEPAETTPPIPADMVLRRDAIRNHLLIFVGSVVATLFVAEKIVQWRG